MEQKNKGSCITFWMRSRRSAQPVPKTWCLTTKEQGLAGSGAPRPAGGLTPRQGPAPRPVGPETPNHWRGHGAESHAGGASPRAGGPPKKDRRTVGPPNLPILLNLSGFTQVAPTSPSGFSWSSSWIAAFSGFWHVPARYGRSAAGPWSRTGSNNSCC